MLLTCVFAIGLEQILGRLNREIKHLLQKSEDADKKKDQRELAREFQQLLRDLNKEPEGRKFILIIDGLNKMDSGSKVGKVIF